MYFLVSGYFRYSSFIWDEISSRRRSKVNRCKLKFTWFLDTSLRKIALRFRANLSGASSVRGLGVPQTKNSGLFRKPALLAELAVPEFIFTIFLYFTGKSYYSDISQNA